MPLVATFYSVNENQKAANLRVHHNILMSSGTRHPFMGTQTWHWGISALRKSVNNSTTKDVNRSVIASALGD